MQNSGSTVDSFWDEDTTGADDRREFRRPGRSAQRVASPRGNTATDPFTTATYGPFDFNATWSTPSAGEYPQLYGVSHVLRLTAEDTTTVYADFPVYTVDEFGFQPLEGPSLVSGLSGGATNLNFSSSGHYVVTAGTPYPIVFSGASATSPDGSGAYRFIYQDGNLTVTQRQVDPGLDTIEKTYDSTTDAPLQGGDYQIFGSINGDDVSVTGPTGANAGTYDSPNAASGIGVSVGGLSLTGNDAQNYVLSSTSIVSLGVGQIDPEQLFLSAVTDTKTYDGTTSSVGVPIVVGGTLYGTDSVSATQSFTSKNAGPALSATLAVDAGSIVVNDTNSGNNYFVDPATNLTAQGTINPAPLTLSAVTDSKVYDGTIASGRRRRPRPASIYGPGRHPLELRPGVRQQERRGRQAQGRCRSTRRW